MKKITILTTQGVDTSRFYPEMVIASATSDLVEKKLVFNYLSIYWLPTSSAADIVSLSRRSNPKIFMLELRLRYLELLAVTGRQQQILEEVRKENYPLDESLQICRKFGIIDA